MIHLIDEENQQGQHDNQQEAHAAGQEVHYLAEFWQPGDELTNDVAVGNHVDIGNQIVVALGHIAADTALLLNLVNAVGVQGKFVVDNGMEGDDVAFFQGGGVAFADDDQVTGVERGSHGVGHHAQGGVTGKACHMAGILGGQGGEGEQCGEQNNCPQNGADQNTGCFFKCVHLFSFLSSVGVAAALRRVVVLESSRRFPFSSVPTKRS